MNACIRAVVRTALAQGLEVLGIRHGYGGLLKGEFEPMDMHSVSGIVHTGGTILRGGRCAEIRTPEGLAKAADQLRQRDVQGMVVIGGDGSLQGGYQIHKASGVSVVGVPASIDNDVFGTDETIGFDTAVNTALEAVDRIRDTATAYERVFVVEVMGREHGFLALAVGIASGAEVILVPEVPVDLQDVIDRLVEGTRRGKVSNLVIVAEGFGGAAKVAQRLCERKEYEVRTTVLGYVQRGGAPTARSRFLASLFGYNAVRQLVSEPGVWMVGIEKNEPVTRPLDQVSGREKAFPMGLYRMAQSLAMST
jgi:6-phosphofructokinase 1